MNTKLTRLVGDAIVESIRSCAGRAVSARGAGVHESTLRLWLRRGRRERDRLLGAKDDQHAPREKERAYLDLVAAVEQAEASAELDCVTIIRNAAVTRWTAAAWLLERRFPERYSRNRLGAVQVEQEQQAFLDLLERRLSADVFTRVLEVVLEDRDSTCSGSAAGSRGPEGWRA